MERFTITGSDALGWSLVDGLGILSGPSDYDFADEAEAVAHKLNGLDGDDLRRAIADETLTEAS